MSYGLRRWAMGNFFGCTMTSAIWTWSDYRQTSIMLIGSAIILFFADERTK